MKTSSFKTYGRGQRSLTTEQTFVGGMMYTDTPLPESACKALVNFDFKDGGAVLVPRGGYRLFPANVNPLAAQLFRLGVHHINQATVSLSEFVSELHRYVLFSRCSTSEIGCLYNEMQLLIEDIVLQGTPYLVPAILEQEAEGTYTLFAKHTNDFYQIHGLSFADQHKLPIYCTLNSTPYFPMEFAPVEGDPVRGLGYLSLRRGDIVVDGTDSYISTIKRVVPREITPNEAVNYGYNMLHPTPYSFADQINAAIGTGYIFLHGILPYADANCITPKFNARVGETLTFRLFGSFPDAVSTYKLKWEIRDLNSDTVEVLESQNAANAPEYRFSNSLQKVINNSTEEPYMKITFNPAYKEFALTATAYSTADLTEPLQVMNLGSYHLTAAAPGSTNSIEVKNYDLSTARGMCVWQQRVVLWGVQSGEQILFTSDPNDPTYFPYPNNVDLFDEAVLHAVPYLSDLLVYTSSRLYRLTLGADGMSFTKSVIQERLMLSDFDASTICVVKNMVYFKNGNYFYMVVPTANDTAGELQLAPISKQITNLLDNFEREVLDLILTMYNPQRIDMPLAGESFALQLLDYHNYMDNNAIRNVYKFGLCIRDEAATIRSTILIFDFILNYDTMLRTWSSYVVESNETRMLPYRQTVTDTTIFLNLTHQEQINDDEESPNYGINEFLPTAELVKVYPLQPADNFTLDHGERRFKNWQYIDTGYRNHEQQIKKRYRELQFKLNNISQQSLQFGTEFLIDDMLRKDLFKYSVAQYDTDPESPYFGWIYIDREYANPEVAVGSAMLADLDEEIYPSDTILTSGDVLQSNKWVLNYSTLARIASTKVRFPVSGKGYCPRLKLLSFNEQLYEILTIGYVYRIMNAR
jgi:hypothetical protein